MQGALTEHAGVLYVGRHARTAVVEAFDLDGRPLDSSWRFRDEVVGRSSVDGLALDADHRVWVADRAARRLRAFTLFGREVVTLGGSPEDEPDRHGRLGRPVDVACSGSDAGLVVGVVSAGRRRHAAQLLHPDSGRTTSLRPLGDPEGRFQDARALVLAAGRAHVLESGRPRVQVFEGEDFHYALDVPCATDSWPTALAVGSDGDLWVAVAGARCGVLRLQRSGRGVERVLPGGEAEGCVDQPGGLVLASPAPGSEPCLVVLDREGERVQVFTLEGRCYGTFTRAGQA